MARVLVVDDEPDILLLLRIALTDAGHEVLLAADGEKALERIAADQPDIVLLDVMMPVLDGWSVLGALRDDGAAPPVVVVSAKTGRSDISYALGLGAADYITKPFDIADVSTALAATLTRSPEEREAHRQQMLASLESA